MIDRIFKVEKIETPTFDENGQENGTWKGYSVKKIEDPANVAFDCRDKKMLMINLNEILDL